MSKTGMGENDYGMPVSQHVCGECGSGFTVCPPAGDDWGGCQSEECSSYDPDRDVDDFVDEGRARREAIQ